MKDSILYIWLQLSLGICSRLTNEIFPKFQSMAEIYNSFDFSFLGEKREKYIKRLENKDTSQAFEIFKMCESKGIEITGYYDERYPDSLRKIDSCPAVLYSIGNFRDLNKIPCVGIVGTRNMSDYGRRVAEDFGHSFGKSGVCVISGLAKGVDVSAHRGCVIAGGYTVGVLGTPIGEIYPKENAKAFETLYKKGLVISEHYPGAPKTRADFPNRNRIISALSDALVVAEAGETSGALITARYATAQGKPVYAVPGALGTESAGTNKLIKNGTSIATEPNDILAPLSLEYPEIIHLSESDLTEELHSYGNKGAKAESTAEVIKEAEPKLKFIFDEEEEEKTEQVNITEVPIEDFSGGDTEAAIISVLSKGKALCADEICSLTGLPVSDIMTELTLMEIQGMISPSIGGRYSLI